MMTTLNAIRAHSPCQDGWEKLLKHLGKTKADDEPLEILTILNSNGLDDALWCFRALPPEWESWARLTLCDLVQPAMKFTADPRPQAALDVTRRYAIGNATLEELDAASAAAWDAARAAARDAARAAASAAAWAAASAAAWAARDARDAARDAARAAARAEQESILRAAIAKARGE